MKMDDILDIDEVLTDSFYMPSEECYNDIQNIVQQWKDNENPPNNVQNESTRYFDTRTFTRQKKRLSSNTNGLADLDYQKSVGFPPMDNSTSCRNFIFDSSPSNSLCSYVSDDTTSLITSGDFSNVSYFINNTNDITIEFNDVDVKKNIADIRCPSSTDISQNSTANRTITQNKMMNNTTIVEKNELESTVDTVTSHSIQLNNTHTIPVIKKTFERKIAANSTFDKKLDDTFDVISAKIAQPHYVVPRNEENYDCLNLIQSTPKYCKTQHPRLSSTPPNLSPITPKKFQIGPNVNDKTNILIESPIEMDESITNDDQQNSLVNFEEFEKSIFLDDDKCDEDFETLLDRMGSSRRLENREVMKESLDNIKKRHSLINLEIKQEHQREKMNHSGENKSMVSSLQKSIPDERLLRRSRLFDNITINTSGDKIDRSGSTTIHLDSNRTFNHESSHKIDSNQVSHNDVCNSTQILDNKPENPIQSNPIQSNPIEVPTETINTTHDKETEQPEKYDNRDRFKTIRLFKKPTANTVIITDTQTQYPATESSLKQPSIIKKNIEPISKLKSRQISTLSTRDSYIKSSSVENLNTRNGFQKLKTDINAGRSSSTQSLDKTSSGLTKTSMLRDRAAAASKNVKPNIVQNVIPKSLPVFTSRQNVNKLSGLVRPSSGYYSFNTDVEKLEPANNVQPSGNSTFVSSNVNSEPISEPKLPPSRIGKPSGLRQPSKISCLPRPMPRR